MKDFNINEQNERNEMNNQPSDNLNENYQNERAQDSVNNDNVNTAQNGSDKAPANESKADSMTSEGSEPRTVDNNYRREAPFSGSENPYFEGYYNRNAQQNPQNNQYSQNGTQSNQNTQYNGYGNNGYNQYQGNRYGNGGYGNYGQQYNHTYNAPHQEQGQISYTPQQKKQKKEKKNKPVSRGAIALVMVITILLSGCIGFGAAMIANNISSSETDTQGANNSSVPVNSGAGGSVVIYRNVDDVDTSTGESKDGAYTYAEVSAIVKDSVVEINTEYTTTSRGWYNYVQEGAGSGVVISEDGYIITNAHVIVNESTGSLADSITVRLTNGDEYTASVKGYDSEADIAILKIEASGLTAAQCGDSDKLAVGEELVIVGNPLGELGGTVTNGIVSATQREIDVNGVTMTLIQTNAAVNPGNSGGGMFNMKGQLVGIVNAKSSGTDIEGLGFAIPINEALEVTEQLMQYGYVRGKTMIGVTFTEVSSNTFYFYYNIQAGVYVDSCTEGYNDDVLKAGDRVVAVNGNTVSTTSDIKSIVTGASVGDKLKFQIERNGKLTEVEVEVFEKVPDSQSSIEFDDNSGSGSNQKTGKNGN